MRVEPKQGGKTVEMGSDKTGHLWSTIKPYDPYDLVSMDFHVPPTQ